MARRALLIGSQTGRLTGVGNDISSMSTTLDQWGFTSIRCEGENASRAGILDAYERLIARTGSEDAVVVYYSGHGGYCRPPADQTGGPGRRTIQFIVPTDYHASTEDDFRGITSFELSLLLARLTEKTKNATVVLDCCHAAHMSRDPDVVVKALSRAVSYSHIAAHLDNLQRRGQRLDLWTPPGNPYAVRIVACAPEQSAYERDNEDGVRTGMLTNALTSALAEVKASDLDVTWSTVIDRVRQQVLTAMPVQRPEAEGPAQRLVFDVAESDPVATLPASLAGDRVRIGGAALLGVRPGDEFVIMPGDSPGPDDDRKIGEVRVDRVDSTAAWGSLRPRQPELPVPIGARAHAVRTAAPVLPVRVAPGSPRRAELIRALGSTPLVRPAEPGEDCTVEVAVDSEGGLTLRDEVGPLHDPRPADSVGIGHVVQDLKRLAQAKALRRLTGEPNQTPQTPVTVEFGRVENGQGRPLSISGSVLYADQPIYVRVRNDGTDTVYVSLLDIGVSARITLLNTSSPAGVRLDAGGEYVFGGNDLTGSLPGVRLSWPDGLDRTRPRPETIVVLVTSEPTDVRILEQQAIRRDYRRNGSKLERYFDQLRTGGLRDVPAEPGPGTRFMVRTIDFDLVPLPTPPTEVATFQVDERPEVGTLLWSPRTAAPASVALRLTNLVVHHNRAFRSADIRLDTVVVTGGSQSEPVFHARTERFSNIVDGQRLPIDNIMVYHGPVADYLDIAIWVSRDSAGSLALSDLLRKTFTDADTQVALGQVSALFLTAPQAAAAVAAIGASAIVVNAAYRLLRLTVGDSIGLYRTTLLAHEQFGVGRQNGQNAVRAQDLSFTYLVEDVSLSAAPRGPSAGR
ncbi:MAG TPA: caspase family protein [Micromonosporaceae bacterium]|nr:caspase family protein [Micromonosporaceae bacterium]